MTEQQFVEFGPFRLDPVRRLLFKHAKPVRLTSKSFQMLLFLVQNAGRLVGKDELLDALWPDAAVEESNLAVTISALRKVLGERRSEHRFIVTVPKQGYRFVAELKGARLGVGASPWGLGPSEAKHLTRSMAVLPFRSLGQWDGANHMRIGIAEALVTRLSHIKGTIVRPATIWHQEHAIADVPAAGRRLGVKAVIDGTIQCVGTQLRVSVRLVRVRDGSVVWADQFDEHAGDLLTVEDSVSDRIVQALMLKLIAEDKQRLRERETESTRAYHTYLKGRYFWERRTEESLQRGIECFKQAIQEDAGYASAYLGLADCYYLLSYFGALLPALGYPKVIAAANKALEFDATLGVTHTTLGCVNLFYDWDASLAIGHFEKSLELEPEHPRVHHWFSQYLLAMGEHDASMRELDRARELDPLSVMIGTNVGLGLYYARQYDEAIGELRRTVDTDPHFAMARWALGLSCEQKGRHEEAIKQFRQAMTLGGPSTLTLSALGRAYAAGGQKRKARRVLDELRRQSARRYVSAYNVAALHVGLGETDQVFHWLQKAFEERASSLVYLHVDPVFDRVRRDARFDKLVARVGLKRPRGGGRGASRS